MYEHTYPEKRFRLTRAFLKRHTRGDEKVLDLGVENPFSAIMRKEGYAVGNTSGEDLDLDQRALVSSDAEIVTAFEIFEHLLNPFAVLQSLRAKKLFISVPLRLWFSPAYRSRTDPWDRHYHEFEEWQLDWLLEKTGWKVVARAKWASPVKRFGLRPVLRRFTDRYYIVYAERD